MFYALMRRAKDAANLVGAALVFALVLCAVSVLTGATDAYGVSLAATTDTTALNEAMKVIFADPLIVNIVSDSELLQFFEMDGENIQVEETTGGRYIEMAHYFKYPAGVGAISENDYLPTPDDPEFQNSRVYLRKIGGVLEMTGDVMDRVVGDEGAFLNYMDRALPDLIERVVSELDRMYIGFGGGIKARVKTAPVAAGSYYSIALKDALGVLGWQEAWVQFLEGERLVFAADAAGTTLRSSGGVRSGRVIDVDEDADAIIVSVTAGLSGQIQVGDYIAAGDENRTSFPNAGTNREIDGLSAAVDDGDIVDTYNNLQRSAEGMRLWRSIVKDASLAPFNGDVNEELLDIVDTDVHRRGSGKPDFFVCSESASQRYWANMKKDRMFVDPRGFTGGRASDESRGLSIMLKDRTLPFRVARKLPPQVAFLLMRATFRRLTLGDWKWNDRTGAIWKQVTDGTGRKDAFYAYGIMRENLICTAPRRNARIEGVSKYTGA